MAKESLFNVLNNRVDFEDLYVLDLFSGTGSISYEFASRGASRILCVELNPRYAAFIQQTADSFGIKSLHVIKSDVFKFLEKSHEKFDIVFADPPYDLPEFSEIPNRFFSINRLNTDGWFVLEHSGNYNFNNHVRFVELRKYGKVNFSFFQ